MIRPVVNGLLEDGTLANLARGVGVTAAVYLVGALCTLGYSQIMVRAAQKILRRSAATFSPASRRCRCSSSTPTARAT